jgi:tRNA (cmo5U34)-methyltransferase
VDRNVAHGEKFEFGEEVTKVFSDTLKRSIPDYDNMRLLSFKLGDQFVKYGSTVIDLGCSRGDALWPYVQRHGEHCRYVGVEVSQPMLEAAQDRFRGAPYVNIMNLDLRNGYPQGRACLVNCVLTLQFLPINYRQQILSKIYHSLDRDGALILVEKVLGNTAVIDNALVHQYHEMKFDHGYSLNEIERKKLALEGVLTPLTAGMNESFLYGSGFDKVDCFWRNLNFAGWICVK